MKKLLIYGDSKVWGDNLATGVRISDEKHWPNILQESLKQSHIIFQEGLPSRIAGDENVQKKYKNGKDTFLSTFRTVAPVDEIIIALGTNDLQIKYEKSAEKIIEDLLWYKKILELEFEDPDTKRKYFVNEKMPNIIYILPVNFDYENGAEMILDFEIEIKRQKIIKFFAQNSFNYLVFNDVTLFDDGIHLDYKGHEMIAKKVEETIKSEYK